MITLSHNPSPPARSRSKRRWLPAAVLLAPALSGCSWQDPDGTRHHLILGLGVVTTQDHLVDHGRAPAPAQTTDHDAAIARRFTATGGLLGFSPPFTGLLFGHMSHQSVSIDRSANILLEAATDDHGRFFVRASSPAPGSPAHKDP